MSLQSFYVHWYHPKRRQAACNRRYPTWACTMKGSEIGCATCAKLHNAWMHKQLATKVEQ